MIYPFNAARLPDLAEVGGKGLSLMRMTQADLLVPPGFVLSVAFFAPWMSHLQATPEWAAVQGAIGKPEQLVGSTRALKAACAQLGWSARQEEQLADALKMWPDGGLFAVRSSSPEEDLAGASFAGGYKTTLGVTKETLRDAIRDSFASVFDERVFVYKQQQGFAVDQPRIAVVIQKQIAADCAGVGFSLNPLNNDYDEAVIDANWGLGESVVAGMVSPDHFVVDKVAVKMIEKRLGSKERALWLGADGGVEQRDRGKSGEFCLTDVEVLALTTMLTHIERLYEQPIDIEWAFSDGKLYLLQARPITTYVPLPPEMLSAPGERRTLYFDACIVDGITMNAPVSALTIDWVAEMSQPFMQPFLGATSLSLYNDPLQSLLFAAGARIYLNLSQLLTIISPKRMAKDAEISDPLLSAILKNVDREQYRAQRKNKDLGWGALLRLIPRTLWHSRHFGRRTLSAIWNPARFYSEEYVEPISAIVSEMKKAADDDLPLDAFLEKYKAKLAPVISQVSFPVLFPYIYHLKRMNSLFAKDSDEIKALADKLSLGAVGNEAVDLGIQLYRMAQMLTSADVADLDELAKRVEERQLPNQFLAAWDHFIEEYGVRGPAEMDLASPRYGDDPRLALEQMSYMVNSAFDPQATQQKHVAERKEAYEKLLTMVKGRKRRKLQTSYRMVELMAKTRDTPKYLMVLFGGAFRQRALREGQQLVAQGRLDKAEDIFDLTLHEIKQGEADPTFDLRRARAEKLPFYNKLRTQVKTFPHIIDSRGRIARVKPPEGDPNTLIGTGISRGIGTGRVKVLFDPREKPIEQGDVLVTYTTDPGWTPLFVNAEAVVLEVGGMLQHGGVVAREYGKPCVTGIQGITTTLQDGQLVEVDGTTGVVRILEA
ncbi:MAG: PEP/pyruvate-binding domain-containing protein [Ardenticatenaceae bacterium]